MGDTQFFSDQKVIGFKQTKRAILQGKVKEVYIASDLDAYIKKEILQLCRENGITVKTLNLTKHELGKLVQIEVGASVIANLKS
ncbi:MAG: L7Ae/L30e/S12e/Gadd45 family ribosomal protein [Bacillota bacterium]